MSIDYSIRLDPATRYVATPEELQQAREYGKHFAYADNNCVVEGYFYNGIKYITKVLT